MKLVIVESPNKCKKISSILGSDYQVVASIGHCIDLPPNKLGVDIKNGFKPTYTVLPNKQDVLANILKLAKNAELVLLSSDPDREGEAIAFTIASQLPKNIPYKRARFHSITKNEVLDAIANAGELDKQLIEAQISRRILDRLTGFSVSPHIMRHVAGAKSAGRVQSTILKLLVSRKLEIDVFKPVEYWDISADFIDNENQIFRTNLLSPEFGLHKEKALEPKKVPAFKVFCEKATFKVSEVTVNEESTKPSAPFTTSSLMQTASSLLGFSAKRTANVAQGLFASGKITYHRTDSTSLSNEFIGQVRNYISKDVGQPYLPENVLNYTNKVINSQEAHEACRVTHLEDVNFTNDDTGKLYELIWRRSVACQMNPSVFTKTRIVIGDEKKVATFTSNSKLLKFDGFLKIWKYSQPQIGNPPKVNKDQQIKLKELITEQKFTNPPSHFSDGSLIKQLESLGIGRPSTLATMTTVLEERNYVTRDKSTLIPTILGVKLVEYLEANNFSFMSYDFTNKMEEQLDLISNGKRSRLDTLTEYWSILDKELKLASNKDFISNIPHKSLCPTCGKNLIQKSGRFGPYVNCSSESCQFKSSLDINGDLKKKADLQSSGPCPKCGGQTFLKEHPRFGKYISCENWKPKKSKTPGTCNYTAQIDKEGKTKEKKPMEIIPDIKCPKCSSPIAKKTGRFGDFYACTSYPKCKTITESDGSIKIRKPRGKKKKDEAS